MTEFVITEEDLNRACDQMTICGYGVSANYIDKMCRSRPLSAALKAEREMMLRNTLTVIAGLSVLMNGVIVLPTRDFTERIISTLGDEP